MTTDEFRSAFNKACLNDQLLMVMFKDGSKGIAVGLDGSKVIFHPGDRSAELALFIALDDMLLEMSAPAPPIGDQP